MLKLDQNISIYDVKGEFVGDLDNSLYGVTPGSIEHDLQQQRQRFERLKFTYMEQETRDTFFRIVVNDEPYDTKQMEKRMEEEKKRCSELEDQMTVRQSELETVLEQVMKLNGIQTEKMKGINELLAEVEGMEKELDSIPEYKEVIDTVDLTRYEEQFDSQFTPDDKTTEQDNDILTYLNNEHDTLINGELHLKEVTKSIETGTLNVSEKQQLIDELQIKMADLNKLQNTNTNEFTTLGNWLIRINGLLSSFTTVKFNSHISDDTLIFNFGKYQLKLNKFNLTVIESNVNFDINEYNTCGNKFKRLSEIIINTL